MPGGQAEGPACSELASLVGALASSEGVTECMWPGLTLFRFTKRTGLFWDELRSLSVCVVAQGRKRVRIGSTDYFYDELTYLVLTRGMRFQAEILEAAPERPFLSLVFQVGQDIVTEITEKRSQLGQPTAVAGPTAFQPYAYVSLVDAPFVDAVLRFLHCLGDRSRTAVLAPLYLREIVYLALWSEQAPRVLADLGGQAHHAIAAAVRYMRQQCSRPLTVSEVASAVCMSESAFAHSFRSVMGVPPQRFLKQVRMDNARELLAQGYPAKTVAKMVGYASSSHFSSEYKRAYGESPRSVAPRGGPGKPLVVRGGGFDSALEKRVD